MKSNFCKAYITIFVIFFVLISITGCANNTSKKSIWATSPTPLKHFEYKINKYDKQIIIESYKGRASKVWVASTYSIDGTAYEIDLDDKAVFSKELVQKYCFAAPGSAADQSKSDKRFRRRSVGTIINRPLDFRMPLYGA